MKKLPYIQECPIQDPGLGAKERADAAFLLPREGAAFPKSVKKPSDIIFLQMDPAEIAIF